jgi:hypothetical protein
MLKDISEADLIKMSKGIIETDSIEYWLRYFNEPVETKSALRAKRKQVRQAVHEIRKQQKLHNEINDNKLNAIVEIFSSKLSSNMGIGYDRFTFSWDIHPNNPVDIVLREHWTKEGGGFDEEVGVCAPTAFTEQEL